MRIRDCDAGVLALLAFPWLLLLVDSEWLYTGVWLRDSWSYHGYFLDLRGQLLLFPDHYPGSRLSIIFPGWLANRLFPPGMATQVLHLSLYYAIVLGLYSTLRGIVARRTASLVTLLIGMQGFLLASAVSDYTDGYCMAFFFMSAAALVRASDSDHWRFWLFVAGMGFAALVVANIIYSLLVPGLAIFYIVLNSKRRGNALSAGAFWVVMGAGVLLVAFALISKSFGGRLFFLHSSFSYASANAGKAHVIKLPLAEWLPEAGFLVLPLACVAGSLLFLARRLRPGIPFFLQLNFLAMVGVMACLNTLPSMVMCQFYYYPIPLLLPLIAMALAGQWDDCFENLSKRTFALLCLALVVLGLVAHRTSHFEPAVGVWACLLIALAGVTLPSFTLRRAVCVLALPLLIVADWGVLRSFQPYAFIERKYSPGRTLTDGRLWEAHRKDAFLAVDRAMRIMRDNGGGRKSWVCYDLSDRLTGLLDRVACYHSCQTLLIYKLDGTLHRFPVTVDGPVVVLSGDTDWHQTILSELAHYSLTARVATHERVGSGEAAFYVTVLEPSPLGDAEATKPNHDRK